METWVQIKNERDRQVLEWLREQVGDAAVVSAARICMREGLTSGQVAGLKIGHNAGHKPYLSEICRVLRLRPPRGAMIRRMTRDVGDRHLARIYQFLQGEKTDSPPRADQQVLFR